MRTSRTGISRHGHGFTLLELILVIFIISLFAALVYPSFSGFTESQLRADARKTASLLRYLNDSAIARKEQYALSFDFRDSALSWKGPEGDKKERLRTLASLTIPSRGLVHDGSVKVFFGPLGAQEQIEVLLRQGDDRLRVTFTPLSGRTKIHEEKR